MPPVAKKTYSRKNQEIHEEKEKENFDPFDELLSSPLKQDVSFKPLSFWNKKLNTYEASKNLKKKNKGLYETSDSDNPSPYRLNEKKKLKLKSFSGRKKSVLRDINQNVFSKSCEVSVSDKIKNYSGVVSSSEDSTWNDSVRYITVKRQCNKYYNVRNVTDFSPEERFKTYLISRDDFGVNEFSENSTTFDSTVVDSDKNISVRDYNFYDSFSPDSTCAQNNRNWETEKWFDFDVSETLSETLKPQERISSSTSENDSPESDESDTFDKETGCCSSQSIPESNKNKEFCAKSITSSETSVRKDIFSLTSMMSDMSIDKENEEDSNSTKGESDVTDDDIGVKDKKESSETLSSDMFRNITKRKRLRNSRQDVTQVSCVGNKISGRSIGDSSSDSPLVKKDRISALPERFSCFSDPIFESTRVFDDEDKQKTDETFSKKPEIPSDYSIVLKPGKKWRRSMSVLKQIQSGSIANFESSKIKGRRFESFVQEMIDLQKEYTGFANLLPNVTIGRKSIFEASARCSAKNPLIKSLKMKGEESLADFDRTSMNHTVKVVKPECALDQPSAFRTALGLDDTEPKGKDPQDPKSKENKDSKKDCFRITAKSFILSICKQEDILPFEKYFNEKTLKDCKKIGEGVYGEVFMYNSNIVLKILPIEGDRKVNGEPQKKFEEILSEVVSASKLSNLRNNTSNRTSGFSEMKRCWCVIGKYPKYLQDLWHEYDQKLGGSENDSPAMFNDDQLYIILEMSNGGLAVESFVFNTSEQGASAITQIAFSLACAESAFQFEHRDLHWGNVLVAPTNSKYINFVLDNILYKVPSKGVKVTIIDFTLSRLVHDGCIIFNDLSSDPDLFKSHGDYQFEIYRMMKNEVENDWSIFKPKTNIYWLHYIVDKMLKRVHYRSKRSNSHSKFLEKIGVMEEEVLSYENCTDFIMNTTLK